MNLIWQDDDAGRQIVRHFDPIVRDSYGRYSVLPHSAFMERFSPD